MQVNYSTLHRSKIVVRHAIANDFKVLGIDKSEFDYRDVQKHYKDRYHDMDFHYCDCFPKLENPAHNYSLKTLAHDLLGIKVQGSGVKDHNAVDNAKVTMRLYHFDELAFEVNAHLWDVD